MELAQQKTRSKIMYALIVLLDSNCEVLGTEQLALGVNSLNSKKDVLKYARRLEDTGEITICRSCGGRGKKTVYKRNRNQEGLPRKAHQ